MDVLKYENNYKIKEAMELEGRVVGTSWWRNDQFAVAVSYPDFASHNGGVFGFPLKMTTRQVLDAFKVDDLKDIRGKTVYLHPYKTGRGYSAKFQIHLPVGKITEYYGH